MPFLELVIDRDTHHQGARPDMASESILTDGYPKGTGPDAGPEWVGHPPRDGATGPLWTPTQSVLSGRRGSAA